MKTTTKMTALALSAGLGIFFTAEAFANPTLEPRGRFHLDYGVHDEDDVPLGDGFLNRRARMGVSGTLDDDWSFRIEYDFAENGTSANDVYLRRRLGTGAVTIGQFKVPMGLNELTSSNNMTFIERASNSNTIVDSRRLGVGYHIDQDAVHFRIMGFGRSIGDSGTADGNDESLGVGARIAYAPRFNGQMVHIGASVAYEDLRDQTDRRFRDRPEARPAGVRLIDTGTLGDVDSTTKYGLELAYQAGPFSAEAEYISVRVDRDDNSDPTFDGYHIQASYVLTGESRGYRGGNFRGISPARSTGAWEIAARYSDIDLNNRGVQGGEQRNITLGVNYYATSNLRFMFNYIWVDVKDSTAVANGVEVGSDKPRIALARAQYSF
ncbi:OprO/OprP family phosphate-selective porin [Methylonatrum kenyense]|uniref:OprO/OprP family phosphate-selective porin n=1 Tax=Methylonatrum kenyense TaxID=455253 RepID=UPI0020BE069A|nr:OprO/OprP family phosphate-selective porin [Methylonatrum kenyense]MCK8515136.1 OprO/OprP family phosphate-selective porin [Methylonatrum kenyense]